MTFAAVHISPLFSIPIAALFAIVLAWYWLRLRGADVPTSRRWIRRTSLVMSLMLVIAACIGLSFVDPRVQQTAYVATWSGVILLVVLIMLAAVADIFNSLRLQREHRTRLEIDAAVELHRAIKDASVTTISPRPGPFTSNGSNSPYDHEAHS